MWTWIRNLVAGLQKPRSNRSLIGRTKAGPLVDEETALSYSAVFGCIRIIAESLAMLPMHVFARSGNRREAAPWHPADWLLSTQANPEMTAFELRANLYQFALGFGNGYAEIERDMAGRPLWLWPVPADRVEVGRDAAGNLGYWIWNNGTWAWLEAENMLHLHGMGWDGLQGYSVVSLARESIGSGLAMDQFAASFFGNGLHAGSVLRHPARLSDQAHEHLKESLKEFKQGAKNAFQPFILEEGMEFDRIGVPPEDAQFLESRTFQVVDICRWFRVPPHKLGVLDRATLNNIEQQGQEFVTETLLPWATRFEQECNVKLFGLKQRGTLYTKHNFGALLRADIQSRYRAYAIGRQWGWLSANDIRELEELNPVPGGDLYWAPLNMGRADQVGQSKKSNGKAQPPGAPEEAAPPPNDGADGRNVRVLEMARRFRQHKESN